MRRCIYCLEYRDESMFDRDHVIPQAFGTFEPDNMVIHCVCRKCNGGLGRTIEQKMARDSMEAIERIKKGLKKPAEWKARGANGSIRVEVTQEGPTKGVSGYYGIGPDGASLTVDIAPTIGISKTEDGPFEWFMPEKFPAKSSLSSRGFEKGDTFYIAYWGMPRDAAAQVLGAQGYEFNSVAERWPTTEPVAVHVYAQIGNSEFRTACKIAMNYVAATRGANYVMLPQFNEARSFIINGTEPTTRLVRLAEPIPVERIANDKTVQGHFVAARYEADRVVVQVSLFSRFQYVVALTNVPFAIVHPNWGTAHIFDLETRTVEEAQLPPFPSQTF